MAIDALRQQNEEKNKPLTETELVQMVGQPIWVMPTANSPDRFDWDPMWVIAGEGYTMAFSKSREGRVYLLNMMDYGKTWIAYRRPLASAENKGLVP